MPNTARLRTPTRSKPRALSVDLRGSEICREAQRSRCYTSWCINFLLEKSNKPKTAQEKGVLALLLACKGKLFGILWFWGTRFGCFILLWCHQLGLGETGTKGAPVSTLSLLDIIPLGSCRTLQTSSLPVSTFHSLFPPGNSQGAASPRGAQLSHFSSWGGLGGGDQKPSQMWLTQKSRHLNPLCLFGRQAGINSVGLR